MHKVHASEERVSRPFFAEWGDRLGRALSFRPGVYRELSVDPRATWQSIVTTALSPVVTFLALVVHPGIEVDPLALGQGILWVLALTVWTGIVYVASLPHSGNVGGGYRRLFRVIGFATPAITIPIAAAYLVTAVTQGFIPNTFLFYGLFVVAWLWAIGMQIQGVHEATDVSKMRAVIALLIANVILAGGFILVAFLATYGTIGVP
jgi:hypothetical protein